MQRQKPQLFNKDRPNHNWASQIQLRLNLKRQWWLWASALLITLLLTLAAASLAFALLRTEGEVFYFLNVRQAVYALLGLVLLFDIYVIHQQLQNHKIQLQLSQQHELFRLIGESAADMIAVVDMAWPTAIQQPLLPKSSWLFPRGTKKQSHI